MTLEKVRQPGSAETSAAWTRDSTVSVLSVSCPLSRLSVLAVSGFQSSFSSGLETWTSLASKLMLSLLCHHQGWRDGVQLTQLWLEKSQKRLAKLDPRLFPDWGSLPRLQWMLLGEDPFQEPVLF